MMKKVNSLVLVLLLLVSIMILPVQATSDIYQKSEIIHTEFGDFEIEITTVIYNAVSRSNSKTADQIITVKQSGKVIAEVTLSATFGYDGKTAWVSSANGSHTTYDGWSYSGEKISMSGGTASLTATLTHLLHRSIPISISLTCSPTGQIS